jgi:preprotein translocase subunit SecY
MLPLLRRLAVTFLIPAAIYALASYLLIPGVPKDFADQVGASWNLSLFALGIKPFISAYWVVELATMVVPRWSVLRKGDPAGRAKLVGASRILGVTLAAFQAFGVATWLKGVSSGDLQLGVDMDVSRPLVLISLVAGACVVYLASEVLTRHGLVNGMVLLLLMDTVRQFTLDKPLAHLAYLEREEYFALASSVFATLVACLVIFRGQLGGEASDRKAPDAARYLCLSHAQGFRDGSSWKTLGPVGSGRASWS